MFKKISLIAAFLVSILIFNIAHWATQEIFEVGDPRPFKIKNNSTLTASMRQIDEAKIGVNVHLLKLLIMLIGESDKLKAGNYELRSTTTPLDLVKEIVSGNSVQKSLTVAEGLTFHQMRQVLLKNTSLNHDTVVLSDSEIIEKISPDFSNPEGLFFPSTYHFSKGSSDLQIYKQAHNLLIKKLNYAWKNRDISVPYKNPYDALIMASIIEKETARYTDRRIITGVLINRLKIQMLLQTDPTVIYGMGKKYQGSIKKSDLHKDTPYNTYTRIGLPPTPIALPSTDSIYAVMHPVQTDALYFVAGEDGSSHFSNSLSQHNKAVNRYQR